MVLEWILGATVAVSLLSLIGVLLIRVKGIWAERLLFFFVSFSAGTFLGAAFFDLLPEALGEIPYELTAFLLLCGIIVFFMLEKVIHWHHHHSAHEGKDEIKIAPLGYLNIIGDGLHNFFDGAAIAASFMAGFPVGIATTIAIIFHEIPQEFGDFSLMVYSGFSRKKALIFNLLSGLLAIIGALFTYFATSIIGNISGMALAFSCGMFIYMANSDIFPELHKEKNAQKSILQLLFIILGIATIYFFGRLFPE